MSCRGEDGKCRAWSLAWLEATLCWGYKIPETTAGDIFLGWLLLVGDYCKILLLDLG